MGISMQGGKYFMAHKRYGGKLHCKYGKTREEAEELLKELESRSKLQPPKYFHRNGKIIKLSIKLQKHAKRHDQIIAQFYYTDNKKLIKSYQGNFNELWDWMKQTWANHFNLSNRDLASYRDELKNARNIYMREVWEYEKDIAEEKKEEFKRYRKEQLRV